MSDFKGDCGQLAFHPEPHVRLRDPHWRQTVGSSPPLDVPERCEEMRAFASRGTHAEITRLRAKRVNGATRSASGDALGYGAGAGEEFLPHEGVGSQCILEL